MGARCTSTTTRRTMPTAAAQRTIRWVSHDRPGYGGSTPQPGRDVASAAAGVAGMAAAGAAELRAATAGRETLTELLASSEFDPEQFTPADHAMFDGPWSWLGVVAGQGLEGGLGGMVDDDLAYVAPWGFDPGRVSAPVLLLHGGADRIVPSSHTQWLAGRCPSAQVWLRPDDGHISVLSSTTAALEWLADQADGG